MHYACERERQRQSSDSRQCHWSRTVIGAYVNYVALTELLQWLWCYCYYCCCYRCFSARFALSLYWFFAAACKLFLFLLLAFLLLLLLLLLFGSSSGFCCFKSLLFSPHGPQLQLLLACSHLPFSLILSPPVFPSCSLPLPRSQVALKPVTFYSFQFVVYFLLISRFMQLSPPSPPSLLLFLLNAVWPHKICKLKVAIVLFSSFSSSSSTYQKYSKLWHALLIVNAFSTFCGFI